MPLTGTRRQLNKWLIGQNMVNYDVNLKTIKKIGNFTVHKRMIIINLYSPTQKCNKTLYFHLFKL